MHKTPINDQGIGFEDFSEMDPTNERNMGAKSN